jgi:hypothetical protein
MPTVLVEVADNDIQTRMREMRIWLDAHHCETSAFRYQAAQPRAVAEVVFSIRSQASAFATAFAGRLI